MGYVSPKGVWSGGRKYLLSGSGYYIPLEPPFNVKGEPLAVCLGDEAAHVFAAIRKGKRRLSVRINTQFIHFYYEGISMNSQEFSSPFFVVIHMSKDISDVLVLEVANSLSKGHLHQRSLIPMEAGKVPEMDDCVF